MIIVWNERKQSVGQVEEFCTGSSAEEPKSSLEKEQKEEMAVFLS